MNKSASMAGQAFNLLRSWHKVPGAVFGKVGELPISAKQTSKELLRAVVRS
jgi:hypothetical protein